MGREEVHTVGNLSERDHLVEDLAVVVPIIERMAGWGSITDPKDP
jgi:hypothetical protein